MGENFKRFCDSMDKPMFTFIQDDSNELKEIIKQLKNQNDILKEQLREVKRKIISEDMMLLETPKRKMIR